MANSVPLERSFSILNLLFNKLRNRLNPIRVDRLQNIYINERVLARLGEADFTEDMKVELEQELITAGEDATTNPALYEHVRIPLVVLMDDDVSNIVFEAIEHDIDDETNEDNDEELEEVVNFRVLE
jgi:hypothetical protein